MSRGLAGSVTLIHFITLAVLLLLMSRPAGAQTAYDALWYHPSTGERHLRPQAAVNAGTEWLPTIHYHWCRLRNGSPDESHWLEPPDEDRVRAGLAAHGVPDDYDGLICLDAEPYVKVEYDEEAFAAYYAGLIGAWRAVLPDAKIGVFGWPTIRVTIDGDRIVAGTDRLPQLYELVDVVFPQVYTGATTWNDSQEARSIASATIARSVAGDKPVIAFVHDRTVGADRGNLIEPEAFAARARTLIEHGADGIALWSAEGHVDRDETEAIWTEYLIALKMTIEPRGVAVEHPDTGEIIEIMLPAGIDPTTIHRLGEILLSAWQAGRDSVTQEPPADPCEGKININTATAVELQSLPNIGIVMSRAIIDYREKQNEAGIDPPFASIMDLMYIHPWLTANRVQAIIDSGKACTGE